MQDIVEILRYNNEGLGIAKTGGMTVFVYGALIGETVKIEITEKNKNFFYARTIEVIKKSTARQEPICKYYNQCGGCNLEHMKYEQQLELKKTKVKDIFKKICNIDISPDIESSNYLNYRNKITLKVNKNHIGFYSSKTHDIIDINECKISDNKINEIITELRDFINKYESHNISEIMIRIGNSSLISIDRINNKLKDVFIESLSNIVDTIYIDNKKKYGDIQVMNILDYNFISSPKSFFQVNKEITEKIYEYVLDNIDACSSALDLYCGVGTITSLLSKKCKKVIGIEYVPAAVDNAIKNKELNKINNIDFICGKVEDNIDKLKKDKIDLIVLDPPRSGSDKKTLKTIKEINPKQIVYISCNPVTLAKDLNSLFDKYELKSIKLFDMFPNTYHVESICVLERKK